MWRKMAVKFGFSSHKRQISRKNENKSGKLKCDIDIGIIQLNNGTV